MRRVLILGAGASVTAGYPSTNNLFERMGAEVESARCVNLSTAWNTWLQYLKDLPPQLEILRAAQNPELILSFTDLLCAAATQEDRRQWVMATEQETGQTNTSSLDSCSPSEGRELALNARTGRTQLLEALTHYFAFRHWDDGNAPRSCRDYLRPFLSSLRKGDAVLTFNWDSLVEHTLIEDGRWSPTDGYGFPRQFTHGFELQERIPIPDGKLPVSDIKVLKLHGSFGWKRMQSVVQNDLFLDANDFLSGFEWPDKLVLHDTAEPAHYSPTDPVVAYPSYLKQLSHPVMGLIWRQAASCLEGAQCVEIIGYSLPSSDSAALSLLLPLAQRVRNRQVRVIIRDPCSDTLERWKELLGSHAKLMQEGI